MNRKLTSGIIAVALTAALAGCAGHTPHASSGVLSSEQIQNWKQAATEYQACNKIWWEQEVSDAPQWKQLVDGHSDPQFLQKLTSKAPLTAALKESLIKRRPQQMACRKALFDALGHDNPEVKMMYRKNFNDLDEGFVKILDGKIKTMGELNQAYLAFNNDVIERRARLMAHSPRN